MKAVKNLISLFAMPALIILAGCIHEYPYTTPGGGPQPGVNPDDVAAAIEVTYDISWQEIMHTVDFSVDTKAGREAPHRFIIEVKKDDDIVCRDVEYVSDEQFVTGRLSHKLSVNLSPHRYRIAVWYDRQTDVGTYPFIADNLGEVTMAYFSTTDADTYQCAYVADYLDLSGLATSNVKETLSKELRLQHAGARFEIIATDVEQFITDHRAALFQGDMFYSNLTFFRGTSHTFNLHDEILIDGNGDLELSGRMRLPYDDYEELKIAEGFIFCNTDSEVTAQLSVTNSALVTVSQTGTFNFPVKRGYITIVSGDFLTNPIDGVFSINNIWEGEIEITL